MIKARITVYASPDTEKELTEDQYDKVASVVAAYAGEVLEHSVAVRILSGSGSPYFGKDDKVFLYKDRIVHIETEKGRRGRGMTIDPFSGPYTFDLSHHYGHSCHPTCCQGIRGRKQAPMWTVRDEPDAPGPLVVTMKGKRQDQPGLEWYPGTNPTVQELKDFLDIQDPGAKVRIGSEGVCKHIAVVG